MDETKKEREVMQVWCNVAMCRCADGCKEWCAYCDKKETDDG